MNLGIVNPFRPIVDAGDERVKRLECLDGLRGVLALYVLLTHMAPFAVLPPGLLALLTHGEAGVDLFFVLSGLVIVRSLEQFDYHARPFLIARAARIFPVFLLVFVVAVAVQPIAIDFAGMPWIGLDSTARSIWSQGWPGGWAVELVAHLTMLHGLFPNGILPDVWVSFLGAAWSLSTEWQFYALVALIGARFGSGERALWRLVALLLGLALLGLAWREAVGWQWQFSRAFLPNKAAYFALGVASAAVLRQPVAWPRFLGVLVVVLAMCATQDNSFKLLPPLAWVACLAAQFVQDRPGWPLLRQFGCVLRSAPLRWLGAVSYCVYLVNEPIQKLLGVMLATAVAGEATLFTVLWVPAAVLLPVGAAWWLHVWIEAPAQRRGRALAGAVLERYRRRQLPEPSGTGHGGRAGPKPLSATPNPLSEPGVS
jgi:peptidoglycan/LPS O-acetylase OafA/YrhL